MRAMGAENVSPGASHYCVWTLDGMSERVSLLGVGKVRIGALGDETRVTGGGERSGLVRRGARERGDAGVGGAGAEDVAGGGHAGGDAGDERGSREGETVRLARRRRWGR